MDITSSPPPTTTPTTPTTTTTTTTSIKSLDQDSRIQPNHHTLPKPLPPPFTNGVLKRHKPRHHHHNHHNPPPVVVAYKECLKNHAASMGGHAVDGCGEFMPSASSTPTDPTSLKCAACGCHRNFHRRAGDSTEEQFLLEYQPHHRHHPPPPPPPQPISVAGVTPNSSSPADSPSPPPISSSYYPSAPHMLLALSSGVSVQHHPETHHGFGSNPNPNGKKRFRTKFSQDQKEKMHELAERVGWKMQKRDEELIKGFCNEIGVDKGVFKVWMHNNKMTFGVKNNNSNNKDSGGGIGIDFLTDRNNHHHHELQQHHQQQEQEQEQEQQGHNDSVSSGGGNVIGTNGSSSSS